MFACDIDHRRSVAVLCMLYRIKCNPMHPLNDALPEPYALVRITRGDQVTHRYTYAPPHSETRSSAGILFSSQCPSGMILHTPCSMVWNWRVSREGPMLFYGLSCSIPTIVFYYIFLSLLPVYRLVLWGWGLLTDRVYMIYHCPSAFHCRPLLIIIIKIT